jgi:hypothetical protein
MKGGACARLTLKPDLAALHFDQVPGYIETQASSWDIADVLILGSEEFLENFLLIFR